MMGQQPILILKEGTKRERGKGAQSNNIAAAKAVAEAVRTTLGPRGMDKMLVDGMGDVVITNDGVTILKEVDVEHPAAKMVVEVAKTQDEECGDGTTTAVILSGELLKRSEELLEQNVHPTIITQGYRMAMEKAVTILSNLAEEVTENDTDALENIAITAMTGKSAGAVKEDLAKICVEGVVRVGETRDGVFDADKDYIQIEKKQGGSISDTELIKGVILDKERVHSGMPNSISDATIALVDTALEVKKTEVDAKIQIRDPTQLQAFLDEEEKMLKQMAQKVTDAGANVLICQKGIDDLAQHFLAKNGVFAIRRAKKSDMEKLSKATGARIVTSIDDLAAEDLGKAGSVEEVSIAGGKMTFVTKCASPKAVSILIRGGTEHVIDEIERAIHDAIGVVRSTLSEGHMTVGGGAAAMEISQGLRNYANEIGGREQMAIEAFALAVEVVPRTLAENAGMDPINTLIDMRKAHADGNKYHGLNAYDGKIDDMKAMNVLEPLKVGTQALRSATETAIMVLRIDDVIASKGGGAEAAAAAAAAAQGGMGGMGGMPGMM